MAKEQEAKAEAIVKVEPVEGVDPITAEWQEAICKVSCYRKQLQDLTDEKDLASAQRAILSKHVFDLQNEIRLLEAKILLAFEHVVKINYGAPQMVMIAEGQLHSVE